MVQHMRGAFGLSFLGAVAVLGSAGSAAAQFEAPILNLFQFSYSSGFGGPNQFFQTGSSGDPLLNPGVLQEYPAQELDLGFGGVRPAGGPPVNASFVSPSPAGPIVSEAAASAGYQRGTNTIFFGGTNTWRLSQIDPNNLSVGPASLRLDFQITTGTALRSLIFIWNNWRVSGNIEKPGDWVQFSSNIVWSDSFGNVREVGFGTASLYDPILNPNGGRFDSSNDNFIEGGNTVEYFDFDSWLTPAGGPINVAGFIEIQVSDPDGGTFIEAQDLFLENDLFDLPTPGTAALLAVAGVAAARRRRH